VRQWDGGPKDVKGYGGFFGGAAAGLAEGVAQIGLAEFKQEKQLELAQFEADAERALKTEDWERADKRQQADWDQKERSLLSAEERKVIDQKGQNEFDAEQNRLDRASREEERRIAAEAGGKESVKAYATATVDAAKEALASVYGGGMSYDQALPVMPPEARSALSALRRQITKPGVTQAEVDEAYENFLAGLSKTPPAGGSTQRNPDRDADIASRYGLNGP
jgi:hypothetical protein